MGGRRLGVGGGRELGVGRCVCVWGAWGWVTGRGRYKVVGLLGAGASGGGGCVGRVVAALAECVHRAPGTARPLVVSSWAFGHRASSVLACPFFNNDLASAAAVICSHAPAQRALDAVAGASHAEHPASSTSSGNLGLPWVCANADRPCDARGRPPQAVACAGDRISHERWPPCRRWARGSPLWITQRPAG